MSFTDLDKSLSTPLLSPKSKGDYSPFHRNASHTQGFSPNTASNHRQRPPPAPPRPPPLSSPAAIHLPPGINVTRGSSRDSIGLRHHFAQHPPSSNFTRLQAVQALHAQQQGRPRSSQSAQHGSSATIANEPAGTATTLADTGVGVQGAYDKNVRDDTPHPTIYGLSSPPLEIQHMGSGRPLIVSSPPPPPPSSSSSSSSSPASYFDQFHRQQQKFYSQTPTPMTRVLTNHAGVLSRPRDVSTNTSGVYGDPNRQRVADHPPPPPPPPRPSHHPPVLSPTTASGGPRRFSPDASPTTPRWSDSSSPSQTSGTGTGTGTGGSGFATPVSLSFLSSLLPNAYYSSGSHGATIDQRPNTEHENGDNRTNNDRNSYNRISSYNNSVYHEVAGNDDNLSATSTQLAPLMSASEQYEYETRHLSQQIFNISSNIAVLERLIPCLGQRHKDTVEMRESLHSVLDQTRELVKSANTQVKHLARFHLPQALQSHPGGDGSGNGSAGSSSNGDGALSFTPQRQRTYGSIGEDLQPLVQHVSPSRPTANNRRNDHIAMDMVERGLLRRPVIQYSDLTPAQRQVVTNRRLTHQRLTKDLTVVTKAFQDLQRRAIEAERQQVAQLRRLSSSCASLRQQSAESMEEANNSDAQDMYEGDGVEGVPIMKLDLDLKVVPLMNRPEDTTTGVLPRLDSSKARTPHGDMAGKLPHQPGPPQTAAFPRRPRHPQQLPEDPSSNQKEQRRHPQQQHTHPHDRQLSVQEQAHLAELRWMDSELELQEAILQEREEEILKIEHGMTQVLQVMQELGAMVHEQRAGVDMLQDSISQTRSHIDCAHQEIVQASDYERKSRERLCYLLMIISLVVFVVLLAITS